MTFVSTAFMKLIAAQAISMGIERRYLPKLFKAGPGLLSYGLIRALLNSLHMKPDPCFLGQVRLLLGLEDAVLESRCDYLAHECT